MTVLAGRPLFLFLGLLNLHSGLFPVTAAPVGGIVGIAEVALNSGDIFLIVLGVLVFLTISAVVLAHLGEKLRLKRDRELAEVG
ncbi:hypothetical protein FB45DRAFT_915297 [Roridomyces roridus]|uniref:NADH dehydrogenase subunit 4L n=1 Tax=Roridomyces roridus TaxID=1738132 RepID=A0AAD7BTB6_9AGAR|nr:hypothetical protein FB45DRAFT_915297 [Roridomyces roridus]